MEKGFIFLHRSIWDNPIVTKSPDHLAVWVYLITNATHTNMDVWFDNHRVELVAGQLITGRKSISEKTKVNESKVQRILKTFKSEQQIEQQTTSKNRLITIVNWEKYQTPKKIEQRFEQQVNNKRTTSEQQVNINNNVNNDNKDNNVISIDIRKGEFKNSLSPYLEKYGSQMLNDFFKYWTEKNPKGRKMRFEMSKNQPFDVSRRLATWKTNEKNWGKVNNPKGKIEQQFEIHEKGKQILSGVDFEKL